MLKKLARLADHLDKLGRSEEANYIDDMMSKFSSDQTSPLPSLDLDPEPKNFTAKLAEMLVRGSSITESDDGRMLLDNIKNILDANPEVAEVLWSAVSASSIKEEADEEPEDSVVKFPPGYLHFYLSDGETPFIIEEKGSRWEGARSYPLVVNMKEEYEKGKEIQQEGHTFIVTEKGKAVLK